MTSLPAFGARIRTPTGRSVVQAVHNVPSSVCHSNDPRNGLALCPLYPWAFDEGMLTIGERSTVQVHAYAVELPADQALRGLDDEPVRLPAEAACGDRLGMAP